MYTVTQSNDFRVVSQEAKRPQLKASKILKILSILDSTFVLCINDQGYFQE